MTRSGIPAPDTPDMYGRVGAAAAYPIDCADRPVAVEVKLGGLRHGLPLTLGQAMRLLLDLAQAIQDAGGDPAPHLQAWQTAAPAAPAPARPVPPPQAAVSGFMSRRRP